VTARRLRVGVVGTGFGATVQIPAFQGHPRVEVVAVASGTPGRARQVADRFRVPRAFDAWEGLVAADLDLVSITTPPHLHHPMALAALGAGRHVLCEKPMALSAAEALAMTEAAERRGALAWIDHELRFNPNRRRAKALLEQGYVGRPRHALVTLASAGRADPSRPWTWLSEAARGGGLLGAVGSHQVDLLRHWLGEIVAVQGTVETFVRERPRPDGGGLQAVTADDFTAFSLRFASGAVATVLLSAVAPRAVGPRLEVWGDAGALWLDGAERLWGVRAGGEPEELSAPETTAAPPGLEYAPLWGLSFVRLVEHLASAALDGAPAAPAATFRDGLAVQRVLDAVRASAAAGWTALPPGP
jgi:predicted dehydrogenase